MKVSELIEKLQEMDQAAVVNIPGVNNEGYIIDKPARKIEEVAVGWAGCEEKAVYEVFIE